MRVRQKERVKYNRKRTLKKRQKKKIWRVGNILGEGSVGEKKER